MEHIVDVATVRDCKTLRAEVHLTDSGDKKKRWQPLCHERHRRELNVRKFFRETRREGEEARRDRRDDQNIRVFNSPKGEEGRSGGGGGTAAKRG